MRLIWRVYRRRLWLRRHRTGVRKKITQQAHRALLTGLRAVQEDEGDGFAIRLLLCYPYFENPAAGRRQVCLENPQAAACIQKEGAPLEGREEPAVRISVRNLVEFILRSGDLDNRRTAGAKKEAMLAGGRLHRKIQRAMGGDYRAEVSLKCRVEKEGVSILVEGRADGIFSDEEGEVIDEIKCVYMDPARLTAPDPLHLAQALCYAYMYARDRGSALMGVQITYCSIETEEIRRFRENRTMEELSQWFDKLTDAYARWARYLLAHRERRQESLKKLEFPYPYRDGQRQLAVDVYRCIARQRNLFIQAPTGVGKTLSTIFPSLKAMGEGHGEKLFYLTAKTITRRAAEEALDILRERGGLYFTSVTVTAKEKLCILKKPDCNPEACERAKGHFDRVNQAVYEMIVGEDRITREKILQCAEHFQVCPFELCLDLADWADGIICDYNYVFDPNVRLKRYFGDGSSEKRYLFLVDEAHNLVDRAREMYSASLIKEDILAARKILRSAGAPERLLSLLGTCSRRMLAIKRSREEENENRRQVLGTEYELLEDVNLLELGLLSLMGELDSYMNERSEFPDRDKVLEFYFQVRDFLAACGRLDDSYRIYSRMLPGGEFMVKLMCINPSAALRECLSQSVSTLFFSATLLPVGYYKELLWGSREEYAVYALSPFPRENRLILAARDVSSRYGRRIQGEYEKICDYICRIVEGRQGNYMVFCPSYAYLAQIQEILEERLRRGEADFTLKAQKSHMEEAEREEFLEQFSEKQDKSLAALCVMGGIFSEGIDLREERLIGAIIIGTGLPQVNVEQEILRDYFDSRGDGGFAFAYQYPGMNKVMQAAGRVIRTARDKGVIALLDDRFLRPEYTALFPREWESYTVVDRYNVAWALEAFWGK